MTEPSTTDPPTVDELRALIDRDCPHRRADLEQQITDLYEQIQTTNSRAEALPLFDEISRLRHHATKGLR
ncbi:hypothetical protein [Streptomyces sp. NPDC059538]|uniref:hypothetical protein n=1 Tax=Streptomyces sp. NPDC059538 TaxID=3346860 RepID=UPI0036A45E2D